MEPKQENNMRHLVLAALAIGFAVGGCGVCPRKAASPEETRAALERLAPKGITGTITAILPDRGLLAVSGVPLEEFSDNDTFVIIDRKKRIIGAGHVVGRTAGALHLSFRVNELNVQPVLGDFAVGPTM